jgi:hypothetical protein
MNGPNGTGSPPDAAGAEQNGDADAGEQHRGDRANNDRGHTHPTQAQANGQRELPIAAAHADCRNQDRHKVHAAHAERTQHRAD